MIILIVKILHIMSYTDSNIYIKKKLERLKIQLTVPAKYLHHLLECRTK